MSNPLFSTSVASPALEWRAAYAGQQWVDARLPHLSQPWVAPGPAHAKEPECTPDGLRAYVAGKHWVAPSRRTLFLTDMHADADAYFASLVAAGAIEKTGPQDADFVLTPAGATAAMVIGGDCFDKGPSTFRLLAALRRVIEAGADVQLLAGNHDVRAMLGLLSLGRRDARHEHLFARMGKKAIPWLAEAADRWLPGRDVTLLSDEDAAARLFPRASWYERFPAAVKDVLPERRISKELVRLHEKCGEMRAAAAAVGLSLPMLEAAARVCRHELLSEDGELRWFFDRLQLLHLDGSYLFVHAGVDDIVASRLLEEGPAALNDEFRALLTSTPFELYNGPLGGCFRTKYRPTDLPLTGRGVCDLHRAGVHAIVHGHRSLRGGQRLTMRSGMLNFECDASVDAGTRERERFTGSGAAATILEPDGRVIAVSSDHAFARVFHPGAWPRLQHDRALSGSAA